MELARWLDANKPEEMESRTFAESLAAAYFSLVLEHHVATAHLFRDALPSSAFALLRPVFDAYLRGEWVRRVAGDDQLERFRTGKFEPAPDRILKALRTSHPEIGNALEKTKRKNWPALSGFTHGGFAQMAWQLKEGSVGPNFSDEFWLSALDFADSFARAAAISLAEIARIDPTPFEARAMAALAPSQDVPNTVTPT